MKKSDRLLLILDIGLIKLIVKGNYFHKEDKIKYGALYCADILRDIVFKILRSVHT